MSSSRPGNRRPPNTQTQPLISTNSRQAEDNESGRDGGGATTNLRSCTIDIAPRFCAYCGGSLPCNACAISSSTTKKYSRVSSRRKKRVLEEEEDDDGDGCSFRLVMIVFCVVSLAVLSIGVPFLFLRHSADNKGHPSEHVNAVATNKEDETAPRMSAYPFSAPSAPCLFFDELEQLNQKSNATTTAIKDKQEAVRNAFQFAFSAYAKNCWGKDELNPLTLTCFSWLRQGLTIVDSIDTLIIMGLKDEYNHAREWIETSLRFDSTVGGSFFETVIRILGGLLTAYELSGDEMYLTKASELGTKLMPAFATPHGLPTARIALGTGKTYNPRWQKNYVVLAEIGTIQMEFYELSFHGGNDWFAKSAEAVTAHLRQLEKPLDGLYPIYVNLDTGRFKESKQISLGAMGDSFYEYLLKMFLLSDRKLEHYGQMYKEAIAAVFRHLLIRSGDFTYLAEHKLEATVHKQDHLACFFPGLLALGVAEGVDVSGNDLVIAKDLLRTCVFTYKNAPCGIAPEHVKFDPTYRAGDASYHLRPETVESLFILWRVTGDPVYREWGWDIFTSIEKYARVNEGGYAGIKQVILDCQGTKIDRQESFFLAETLKYLYLLFSDNNLIPITGPDAYVFNTEAHPLRKWDWIKRLKDQKLSNLSVDNSSSPLPNTSVSSNLTNS